MVDQAPLRAQIVALRSLLAGAEERLESLLTELRRHPDDLNGSRAEVRRLCEMIAHLSQRCQELEQLVESIPE